MSIKLDLDELDRKARAAAHNGGASKIQWWDEHSAHLADAGVSPEDRSHIAAASPDVVLALVARVRELEDGIGKFIDGFSQTRLIYSELRVMLAKGTVLP